MRAAVQQIVAKAVRLDGLNRQRAKLDEEIAALEAEIGADVGGDDEASRVRVKPNHRPPPNDDDDGSGGGGTNADRVLASIAAGKFDIATMTADLYTEDTADNRKKLRSVLRYLAGERRKAIRKVRGRWEVITQ